VSLQKVSQSRPDLPAGFLILGPMKRTLGILFWVLLIVPLVRAGESARWEDLPSRIGALNDRQFEVVTTDGARFRGHVLAFSTSVVLVDETRSVPRASLDEVRIRPITQVPNPFAITRDIYDLACGIDEGDKCGIAALWVAPFAVGWSAVATPILGAKDLIRRLHPTKVIKVIP
jgi:hypothetical protein